MEAALPWVIATSLSAITLLDIFPTNYGQQRRKARQTLGSSETYMPSFYDSIRANIRWAPPPFIFSIWLILYVFLAVSHTFWVINAEPVHNNSLYIGIWALYFVHLFFNKIWSFLFFGLQSQLGVALSLMDIILVLALAIVQLSLYAIYGAPIVTYVLWGIYILWLIFATVLSIAIFSVRTQLSYRQFKRN